MKSNLKSEADRRHKAHGVETCSYALAAKPANAMGRLKEIELKYPDRVTEVLSEAYTYLHQMTLMHSLFPALDTSLTLNEDSIKSSLASVCERSDSDQLNEVLRLRLSQIYLYMAVQTALNKCKKLPEVTESPVVEIFMEHFDILVASPEHNKSPVAWRFGIDCVLANLAKAEPNCLEPEVLGEIYWRVLAKALSEDIEDGIAEAEMLSDFDLFLGYIEQRFDGERRENEPFGDARFVSIVDSACASFPLLGGMVASTAKTLRDEPEYEGLEEAKKLAMFKSVKRDFLAEAHLWSKRFLDHTSVEGLLASAFITKDTGMIDPEFLHFDFENLEISTRGEKMRAEPFQPDKLVLHKKCPIAFVSGQDEEGKTMGSNFLVRQIDFVTDVFAEHYLGLKEYEPLEAVWCVNEMSPIDEGICDMLVALNSLPFFATPSSCSGHLMPTSLMVGSAPEGKYFCQDGYLGFEINESPESLKFLAELEGIVARYDNELGLRVEAEDERHYVIPFAYGGTLSDKQPKMAAAKKVYEIDSEIGEQKLGAFERFWGEVRELAYRYRPQDKAAEAEFKAALEVQMEGVGPRPAFDDRFHIPRT